MRLARRALATTLATLALATGAIAVAGPASATPEDGKGCIGTPSIPDSYVCVISTNPAGVVPAVTTTPINVTVPKVCYFVDCTAAQTVAVPVPGVTPASGTVAVLWYKGQYIPIAAGTGTVMTLVADTVTLANNLVNNTVVPLVNGAVQTVFDVVNGLPTYDDVMYEIERRLQPVYDRVNDLYYDVYYGYVYCTLNPDDYWYC